MFAAKAIFSHGNMEPFSPELQLVIIICVILFSSVGYGLYATFGEGAKELRDTIDEHAKLHELGIAHGHNTKGLYAKNGADDYPKHKH